MRPSRALPCALLTLVLAALAAPAAAQSPGWATVDVSGSITASLDLVQASNSFGPAGELALFFVEPGASVGSNNRELDLFSAGPLPVGEHAAPACGFAPECPISIFITPVSPEQGTLSNAGSSADGQGNCTLTIDFVDAQGVSGAFDCGWTEIGVTAHGEFDTTAGAGTGDDGDGGGGPGGGGAGSNWPLWLAIGAAGAGGGAAVGLVRRRRRRKSESNDDEPPDCSQYEQEFQQANAAFQTLRKTFYETLAAAKLSSRDQIPNLRIRVDRLEQTLRGINSQAGFTEAERLGAETGGHIATMKEMALAASTPGSRLKPESLIAARSQVETWTKGLGALSDRLLSDSRNVYEAAGAFGPTQDLSSETNHAGGVGGGTVRARAAVADLEREVTSIWLDPSPTAPQAAEPVLNAISTEFAESADRAGENLRELLRNRQQRLNDAWATQERHRTLLGKLEAQETELRRQQEVTMRPWRRLMGPPCNQQAEYAPLEPKI